MIRVCVYGCVPSKGIYNSFPHNCRSPSQYLAWHKKTGWGSPSILAKIGKKQ